MKRHFYSQKSDFFLIFLKKNKKKPNFIKKWLQIVFFIEIIRKSGEFRRHHFRNFLHKFESRAFP